MGISKKASAGRNQGTNLAKRDKRTPAVAELRGQTEASLRKGSSGRQLEPVAVSPEETRRTLGELRAQQVELEAQNEELRRAQRELIAERSRYFELYDLAPMGHLTLDENGLILETNLSAATLLGRGRDELARQPMSRFVVSEDRELYRRQLGRSGEAQLFDLRLQCRNGTRFWAHLKLVFVQKEGGLPLYRVVMSDITERKRAEDSARQAHDQLRQLTIRINAMHEAESHLLSRELHDEFGQMLTGLKLDLAWLASELGEENRELKQKIASSIALVEASVRSVRSIAARLRPRILDELGLVPAIEWVVQDFRERSGIDAEVVSNTRARMLSPEQATAVFRIVQESLTNALRHAHAQRIDLSLHATRSRLTLEVRDDGKGIGENAQSSYESIGLLGMRERALAVGGELTLEGVLGKGTVVRLRLPLAQGSA